MSAWKKFCFHRMTRRCWFSADLFTVVEISKSPVGRANTERISQATSVIACGNRLAGFVGCSFVNCHSVQPHLSVIRHRFEPVKADGIIVDGPADYWVPGYTTV